MNYLKQNERIVMLLLAEIENKKLAEIKLIQLAQKAMLPEFEATADLVRNELEPFRKYGRVPFVDVSAKGELIHAAGTKVNPLDSVGLRADLLFLDGDDPDQLAWALKQGADAKLILVKGAPLELMKARQRRFYFDQGGKLTERFGIRSVPARVRQQGRLLEVSEIALPPKRRTAQ